MNRLQQEDFRLFGASVVRIQILRAVSLRNSGRWSEEQYKLFEETVEDIGPVVLSLVDSFEPKCDVQAALDELIPIANLLRKGGPGPAQRGVIARVERAIKSLRGI